VPPHDPTDLYLLADRLRQGIPDRGFDGRPIPIRHADGTVVDRLDAARLLLDSGVALLDPADAEIFRRAALERAHQVELAAATDGIEPRAIDARVMAVLVSAAVRAHVLARGTDISPSAVNRETLSWYDRGRLRSIELVAAMHAPLPTARSA
jgi:hypothetical protein